MKRNFAIFYTCSRLDNPSSWQIGWCTEQTEGSYINAKKIAEFVKSWRRENENVRDVIITNILELSESDFQDFIKEE